MGRYAMYQFGNVCDMTMRVTSMARINVMPKPRRSPTSAGRKEAAHESKASRTLGTMRRNCQACPPTRRSVKVKKAVGHGSLSPSVAKSSYSYEAPLTSHETFVKLNSEYAGKAVRSVASVTVLVLEIP